MNVRNIGVHALKILDMNIRTVIASGFIAVSFPAAAHVTLESAEVQAGSRAQFVLLVPHGCAGAPTTALRVAVPEGLSDVEPQTKPDWTLSVVADGQERTVTEIAWQDGNLADSERGRFIFDASVDDDVPSVIHIPVIQECGTGVERWIEVPGTHGTSGNFSHPAPSVRVQP